MGRKNLISDLVCLRYVIRYKWKYRVDIWIYERRMREVWVRGKNLLWYFIMKVEEINLCIVMSIR